MQSHRGRPSVNVLDLRPSDQAEVLTSEEESVTLRLTRGDEAEILIYEIVNLMDRLIHLVGRGCYVGEVE